MAEFNTQWTRWKATSIEWLGVIVSCASLVVSIISMFISALCIGIVWQQDKDIERLNDKNEVTQIYVSKLHAKLEAEGFEPPPLPKE